MFVAPTEPEALKRLGSAVNMVPERHGVDYLWPAQGGWAGVQRKEIGDFRASVDDGRLARELAQMDGLVFRWVLLEGTPRFTTDNHMIVPRRATAWTRERWEGALAAVQLKGAMLAQSADVADTARVLAVLKEWSKKERHSTLATRPGPVSLWGKPEHRDFQLHILQGFDGIGPELAGAIIDAFNGVPLAWTVDADALKQVKGLGPKKIAKLMGALANPGMNDGE